MSALDELLSNTKSILVTTCLQVFKETSWGKISRLNHQNRIKVASEEEIVYSGLEFSVQKSDRIIMLTAKKYNLSLDLRSAAYATAIEKIYNAYRATSFTFLEQEENKMPATARRQRSRAVVRRAPVVRRNNRGRYVRSARRHNRSPSTSSRSSSASSRSSQSHSRGRRQPRRIPRSSGQHSRRSGSVMPLYGTSGNMVVGYVRRCRSGVKLCPRGG